MFIAIATRTGWNVYRKGNPVCLGDFLKLATVKRMVENINGKLTVVINGHIVAE